MVIYYHKDVGARRNIFIFDPIKMILDASQLPVGPNTPTRAAKELVIDQRSRNTRTRFVSDFPHEGIIALIIVRNTLKSSENGEKIVLKHFYKNEQSFAIYIESTKNTATVGAKQK